MTTLRKAALRAGYLTAAVLLVVGITGIVVYTNAREDLLRKADAVLVLAGEHDGREQYGVQLVRDGLAPVVVLSNPYPQSDTVMRQMCNAHVQHVDVVCRRPDMLNTRGEAMLAKKLAADRGWKTIIVVSWRYHLPRARYIFDQCFSSQPNTVIMRAVPRSYNLSVVSWEYVYLYQDAAFVKASAQGTCD